MTPEQQKIINELLFALDSLKTQAIEVMETNQNYPNWPAKGEIPKMGVTRKLTDKERKFMDELMQGSKDSGQLIWIDEASSLPSITQIKIPRKRKKQMKKEGSWNKTFNLEINDYGFNASDRDAWLGL